MIEEYAFRQTDYSHEGEYKVMIVCLHVHIQLCSHIVALSN